MISTRAYTSMYGASEFTILCLGMSSVNSYCVCMTTDPVQCALTHFTIHWWCAHYNPPWTTRCLMWNVLSLQTHTERTQQQRQTINS